MTKGRTPLLACGLFLCLGLPVACSSGGSGPTAEQNRQLARADEMLNAAPTELSGSSGNGAASAQNNVGAAQR